MNIFSGDKSIYGKYATIIKKYSRSNDPDAEEWKLSNGEDSAKSVKIFGTYVDCLYAAAAIGLSKSIKIKESSSSLDKKIRANILASAWKTRQVDFTYLYRLMILTDKDLNMTKDERVKKACSDTLDGQEENEFNYFLQFAYGGLIELDKTLSEIHDYTGLSNFASSLYIDLQDDEED
ncbi:MAG: hypothetical protein MR659_00750 [Mollicutes bacterium]|nr:hypothetical protein [Mollicutes bacterium]